jgi:asparagine N-glycosylation enzyme membrane subunit Stt3
MRIMREDLWRRAGLGSLALVAVVLAWDWTGWPGLILVLVGVAIVLAFMELFLRDKSRK